MIKKLISIILCFIFASSAFTVKASYEKTDMNESQIYELLIGLDFIKEAKVTDEAATVNEISQLLLSLAGVTQIHDSVTQAKDMGLMAADIQSMSVEEFIESILNILGYKQYITLNSSNVMDTAVLSGITKGVSFKKDDILTIQNAYKMIYNSLFAPPCKYDGLNIKISENTHLLDNLDIEIVEGVMTANSKTSIYSKTANEKGVVIGNTVYECSCDYDKYLGYMVEAYVTEDGEAKYITPIPNKNEVITISGEDIIDFNSNKIYYYKDNSAREYDIDYQESIPLIVNGKYNKPLTKDEFDYSKNTLKNDISYTFIDNNRDKSPDVCIAQRYSYYCASVISGKNIKDEYSGEILYFNTDDRFYFADGVKAEFKSITAESILAIAATDEEKAELLIPDSDRDGVDVFIISKAFGNTVNSFEIGKDGKLYMTVNEKKYTVNANYGITPAKVASDNLIGMEVNIHIDMMGKIIRYEIPIIDTYSYIKSVYYDDSEDEYYARVYSVSNGHETLKISKNVSVFDPTPTVTQSNIDTVCRPGAELPVSIEIKSVLVDKNGRTVNKIRGTELIACNKDNLAKKFVRLESSSTGEISVVHLPRKLCFGEAGQDNEFNIVERRIILDRIHQITGYETATKLANAHKRGAVIMDTYTYPAYSIFSYDMPADLSEKERYFYGKGFTLNSSYVNIDSNYNVNLCLNDNIEETDEIVEVVLIPCVVKKVSQVVGEDGDILIKLDVHSGQYGAASYYTDDVNLRTSNDPAIYSNDSALYKDIAITELEFGDIVQLNLRGDRFTGFRLMVDRSEDMNNDMTAGNFAAYKNDTNYKYYLLDTFSGSQTFYTTNEYRFALAKVTNYTGNMMRVRVSNNGGREFNFWPTTFTSKLLIDTQEKTITTLSNNVGSGELKAAFYYFLWGANYMFCAYK